MLLLPLSTFPSISWSLSYAAIATFHFSINFMEFVLCRYCHFPLFHQFHGVCPMLLLPLSTFPSISWSFSYAAIATFHFSINFMEFVLCRYCHFPLFHQFNGVCPMLLLPLSTFPSISWSLSYVVIATFHFSINFMEFVLRCYCHFPLFH